MTHVLILHGNGGSRTRFEPLLAWLAQHHPDIEVVIPALSGFDGRPLPPASNYWDLFLQDLRRSLAGKETAKWVVYGHGIGGSLLMEWAARGYRFPNGTVVQPQRVILHSVIGASLAQRWFPKLMRPRLMRSLIQRLVTFRPLQSRWEKRLFLQPERIPQALRDQFFAGYRRCAAFPVFFDLITPAWYRQVQAQLSQAPFIFWWGEKERVVQARYLDLWRADFPAAQFLLEPHWDHFPMLDQPEEFARKFVTLVTP